MKTKIKKPNDSNRYYWIYWSNHFIDCLLFKLDRQNRKRQRDLLANEFLWCRIGLFRLGFNELLALYHFGRKLDIGFRFWNIEVHKK